MYRRTKSVTVWLYICCAMIFVMALVGAITRLTESGLSITHWEPIRGALPPLNDAEWQKAFADYQTIPQYQIFNRGMSLDEFKNIYFWEWIHRLWGRLIGLVFFLPLLVFYISRKIGHRFFIKLVAIFALGGLQGFIGWFMVQSGLEVRTTVSHYRLALHLGFALLLYALILWTALSNTESENKTIKSESSLLWHGWAALGLLAATIVWGAFVAGMRAGLAYNTWPLMNGSIVPSEAFNMEPAWTNAVANTALVQFIHRWLGPTTMIAVLAFVGRSWKKASVKQKKWLKALGSMAIVQVALGISTLLSHIQIVVAVVHQAGAILLLTLMLINLHYFYETTTQNK